MSVEDIQKACRLGESDLLESIIKSNPDIVNQLDPKLGWAPLYRTVICGHFEASKCLLDHSADANIKNRLGEAPLHQAADNNQLELAELLLSYGAEVNVQQNDGDTPLHLASFKGHLPMVQLLLSHHANPNLQNFVFGKTSLHCAAENGHPEVIEVLLEAKASSEITERTGKRAVELAKNTLTKEMFQKNEAEEPNPSPGVSENDENISDGNIEMVKDQLKSVFEPECERQEEIRAFSFGNDLTKNSLYIWLVSNKLEMLFEPLFNNGFDDIDTLILQELSTAILEKIGILKIGHQMRFLALLESERLKAERKPAKENRVSCWVSSTPPTGFVITPTLDEWLEKINLQETKSLFLNSGFDDIDQILMLMNSSYPLDEEVLEHKIGVQKLGHRHRILASLKEEANRKGKPNGISIEKEGNNTACEMCRLM